MRVGVCACVCACVWVCVSVCVCVCWLALSDVEQLFIRNVWAEETTQMIITAISGSLETEKTNQVESLHTQLMCSLTQRPVYFLVIIKLMLITKDNKKMLNKHVIQAATTCQSNHWPTIQIPPLQPMWFIAYRYTQLCIRQMENSCSQRCSKGVN